MSDRFEADLIVGILKSQGALEQAQTDEDAWRNARLDWERRHIEAHQQDEIRFNERVVKSEKLSEEARERCRVWQERILALEEAKLAESKRHNNLLERLVDCLVGTTTDQGGGIKMVSLGLLYAFRDALAPTIGARNPNDPKTPPGTKYSLPEALDNPR